MALIFLLLISQVYKHSVNSTSSRTEEGKSPEELPLANAVVHERKIEKRQIVLPYLKEDDFEYVEPWDSFFRQKHNVLMQKVDWHNKEHIAAEKSRQGPGEQGKAFKLTDSNDIAMNNQLLRINGYWARASDIISVNRSVADIRHPLCSHKKYLKELPAASVIIPFFNDHLSVLMRTVHSCINRAPPHLLKVCN